MSEEQTELQEPSDDLGEMSFADAMNEVEGVLTRLEGDEIDVDQLAAELSTAAKLLDVCRQKIRRAEAEVEAVTERLDPEERGAS